MLISPWSSDVKVDNMKKGLPLHDEVKYKIYQTCCALLDVGFVFILKRTDIFILLWACKAVLLNSKTVIFQIIKAFKKTTLHIALFAMLLLNDAPKRLPVTLLGMTYPGPKTSNDDPL